MLHEMSSEANWQWEPNRARFNVYVICLSQTKPCFSVTYIVWQLVAIFSDTAGCILIWGYGNIRYKQETSNTENFDAVANIGTAESNFLLLQTKKMKAMLRSETTWNVTKIAKDRKHVQGPNPYSATNSLSSFLTSTGSDCDKNSFCFAANTMMYFKLATACCFVMTSVKKNTWLSLLSFSEQWWKISVLKQRTFSIVDTVKIYHWQSVILIK